MTSETFTASTQYNDLLGSSAADRADSGDATQWLKQQGHLQQGELLVGIEAYVSPSAVPQNTGISVNASFLLIQSGSFEEASDAVEQSNSVKARKVNLDMTPEDFFRLFKRFSITLSSNRLLEGRDISAQ